MAKNDRVFQLIQLLNQRSVVTLDTIMRICQIPERTAYRYLNTISEANIPVYYDKELRGYCLTRRSALRIDDLSSQDSVMLVACLQLVLRHLNTHYASMASAITQKVTTRQPVVSEDLARALGAQDNSSQLGPDYSAELSLAIIQWAASLKKSITLGVFSEDRESIKDVIVQEPRLIYSHGWAIEDAGPDRLESTELASVAYVTVQ
jgi:predicted DNA-binding transcriptional regulator YafY